MSEIKAQAKSTHAEQRDAPLTADTDDGLELTCPKCGGRVPKHVAEGLCQKCLLLAGLGFDEPTEHGAPDATVSITGLGRFGDFELLEEVARGGMGIVYKARQLSLNRIVAIKMILSNHLASDLDVQRFQTEAKATAQLEHPNIVPIYEVGEQDGQHYYVMPYITGSNLSELCARGPLGLQQAAELVRTIAVAVHVAHEKGIIHRDLKPANILIDDHQAPKITDFGLAKLASDAEQKTHTGQLLGTPGFMSPEQANGEPVSPTSDVYGLGAILYVAICGRAPFQGERLLEVLMQVRTKDPVSPRLLRPRLSRDLETICLKALEKSPHRRYASAQELADDLSRYLNGEPILASPISSISRASRLIKRHPAISSLLCLFAVVVAASFLLVFTQWKRADEGWIEASKNFEEMVLVAEDAAIKAHEAECATYRAEVSLAEAELNLYLTRVSLAHQKWKENNVNQSMHILQQCKEDLRDWEWNYLSHLGQLHRKALQCEDDIPSASALSPDGTLLATGSKFGVIRIWSLETGELLNRFPAHGGAVLCLAIRDDNRVIASGSSDQTASLRWTHSGELLHEPIVYPTYVEAVDFVPHREQYIASDMAGTLTLRDQRTGEVLRETELGRLTRSIAFAEDGFRFATSSGKIVRMFRTGQQEFDQAEFEFQSDINILDMDIHPNASQVAVVGGGYQSPIIIYDATTGEEIRRLQGHTRQCTHVQYSIDGSMLLTAGNDMKAQLWDVASGRLLATVRGHGGPLVGAQICPDLVTLVTTSVDGSVKVWDRFQADAAERHFLGQGAQTLVSSSDDGMVAVAYVSGIIDVFDTKSRQRLARLRHGPGRLNRLLFSADDGELLLVDAQNNFILSYDCNNWEAAPRTIVDEYEVEDARLSADGTTLFFGCTFGEVYQLNLESPGDPTLLYKHPVRVCRLENSNDGKSLGSLDQHGNLYLYDLDKLELMHEIAAHRERGFDLAFHPRRPWIASCAGDGQIRIWDTRSGAKQLELTGHTGAVHCLDFHPTSARLASGGDDFRLKIWDLDSQMELLSFDAHIYGVRDLRFNADGTILDSVGGDLTWLRHLAPNSGNAKHGSAHEATSSQPAPDQPGIAGI